AATLEGRETKPFPEREGGEGAPITVPIDDDRDEPPATLGEIVQRLREFDPLTMVQTEEAAAISPNAWLSRGVRGMLLHFHDHAGELRHFELRPAAKRGVEVWLEDRRLVRVGSMSAGIEAVDHELANYGD